MIGLRVVPRSELHRIASLFHLLRMTPGGTCTVTMFQIHLILEATRPILSNNHRPESPHMLANLLDHYRPR